MVRAPSPATSSSNAAGDGRWSPSSHPAAGALGDQLAEVATVLGEHIPPVVLARTVGGFSQVIGLITLELGGHFVGGFEPADELFDHAITDIADLLEL